MPSPYYPHSYVPYIIFPSLSPNSWDPLLVIKKTSNNQRLRSRGVNNGRSKRFCSTLCASFTRWMVKTRLIRLRMTEIPNLSDQIAFCAFHSFLEGVQMNAGYIRATYAKQHPEIRIAGSSCRPQ